MMLTLPYPPSVNHYWKRGRRGQMFISPAGMRFRDAVILASRAEIGGPLSGPVMLRLAIYPPDKRRRDIDNVLKAILDALQHAGVYKDDSQVVELHVVKKPFCTNNGRGMVDAEIFAR